MLPPRSWGCPVCELRLVAILLYKAHVAARAVLIWVVYGAIGGHKDIRAWTVARDHVLVCGPAATRVFVGIHGFWYHQWPCKYLGSELSPKAWWGTAGHSTAGAKHIWVICSATRYHDDIQVQATGNAHVWVHARVCVDECGPCYRWRPC